MRVRIPEALPFIMAATSLCGCVLPMPTTLHARGYVVDAATKKPLAGARVTIQNHPKATSVTASDGSFDIPSETKLQFWVPPMEPVGLPGTVVVTKPGYRSKTINGPDQRHPILLVPN